MNEIETRTFACNFRAEDNESTGNHIYGYASVFNSRSQTLNDWILDFKEIIAPGAFNNVLTDDVRALFNHDPNFVLGRNRANTLSLKTDDIGLHYDISVPQTQTIRDLVIEPIKRGDINQSSFAFRVAHQGDEWSEDDDGTVIRTIHNISRLFDISPVTYAAYTDASSATRSLKLWQQTRDEGLARKAIYQRQARERLLTIFGA